MKKPKPTLLDLVHPAYSILNAVYVSQDPPYTKADDVRHIESILEAERILRSAITGRQEKPYVPSSKWVSNMPVTNPLDKEKT